MKRTIAGALVALTAFGVASCSEETPVSLDGEQLPITPKTIEVSLPWDQFASDLEVLGGFGAPNELLRAVIASQFAGELDSRALIRFGPYPRSVSVRDTAGTTRTDSVLTFVGARVVVRLDTISSTNEGPVTLVMGATTQDWHASTVDWTLAVDTIRDHREWQEPGAGPVIPLDTAVWDPAEGDSVVFEVDSATVAAWSDTTDFSRGLRLDLLTQGVRLETTLALLRLDTRASVRPDSLVTVTASIRDVTFVYHPFPEPPPDGIRIGGVPAWRTILDVLPPLELTGPEELCAAMGCPLKLTADRVNYASLVFWSRASDPAFQPTDSVGLDVRPVLSRDALPKSPLGASLIGGLGRRVGPEAFGDAAGQEIEIPITQFIRDLIRGETGTGDAPPGTLALLSPFEPISIAFASFHGPGDENAPTLRLIITTSGTVELP